MERYVLCEGGNVNPSGNKGDELMLHVVMHRLSQIDPGIRFVLPHHVGSYIDRARLGAYQLLWPRDWRSLSGSLGNAMLTRYRHSYGIVQERELSITVNFQGYRFAEFGADVVRKDYQAFLRRRKLGIHSVFLPQAYGPFESADITRMVAEMLNYAELVGVRDRKSLEYLRAIGVREEALFECPDITIDFGSNSEVVIADWDDPVVTVIPNVWMVERVATGHGEQYYHFLETLIQLVEARGIRVQFVNHAPFQDSPILEEIGRRLNRPLEIIIENDAILLKQRIGRSILVVGSRYHGLLAALSQNVPAMATSWSHKYDELYRQYGVDEMLVSPSIDRITLASKLDSLLDPSSYERLRLNLVRTNVQNRNRLAHLWERVESLFKVDAKQPLRQDAGGPSAPTQRH